ncbi:hypothetical protein [Streptomyces sp. cmx-10-25]|uniref:hypothetical protein n=1 Tax=Streptomyces sp. cmx-10-25 TaxID=2790919 RepID=UPI0039814446
MTDTFPGVADVSGLDRDKSPLGAVDQEVLTLGDALEGHPDVTGVTDFPDIIMAGGIPADLTFTADGTTWALALQPGLDGEILQYVPEFPPTVTALPAGPLRTIVAPAILAYPAYRTVSALTSITADTLTVHRPGRSHYTVRLTPVAAPPAA